MTNDLPAPMVVCETCRIVYHGGVEYRDNYTAAEPCRTARHDTYATGAPKLPILLRRGFVGAGERGEQLTLL